MTFTISKPWSPWKTKSAILFEQLIDTSRHFISNKVTHTDRQKYRAMKENIKAS
jgi:hypothetical protein